MKSGVVFIGEDFDDADTRIWPGRWSAHWESDDGQRWSQGPEGVSAQEAIAWGREHADIVLIRPGDSNSYYSAGARLPELDPGKRPSEYPRWPEGQELRRRRAAGTEYLDRSPDAPPIVWRVRAGGELPIGDLAQFVSQFAAALGSDDAVVDLLAPPRAVDAARFECEFTVRAATIDDARSVALDVSDRASASGFEGLPDVPELGWTSFVEDPEPAAWPCDGSA